jgi:hypothetical protein
VSKALRHSDVEKLKDALCKISSLRNCIKILLNDGPVMVSFTGASIAENSDRFFTNDSQVKVTIAESIKLLLIEEKCAIRKKYNIDIK